EDAPADVAPLPEPAPPPPPGKKLVFSPPLPQNPPPPPADISGPQPEPPAHELKVESPLGFDLSEERTGVVRMLRSSPMLRPVKPPPPKPRRWLLYLGLPLAVALLAGVFFLLAQPEEVRPGKIVVTPSPS